MSRPPRVGRHARRPTRGDFTRWGTFIFVVFVTVIITAVLIFGGTGG